MNNSIETIGVRVLDVSPGNRSSNNNIHSDIVITFNADINPASFANNIVVLEDYNRIFKDVNSLKDYSQYSVVGGTISYRDKVLTYTPAEPFKTDTCYILLLNSEITDITGNKMIKKHVSCFYTEAVASFPRCEILSPKYGFITDWIPEFEWKNQLAPSYQFQVSKTNTFELLLCDSIIPGNTISETIKYTPTITIKEGMYYIRVKCEGGEWSDIHQIFLKANTDAVIAQEDVSEMIYLDEFLDNLEEEIQVLEYFPADGDINISLKTNIVYIKIKGKVDERDLKLDDCYVYGESFDDENSEYSHETVNGSWTIVYDAYFDVSYIIFTPENIDDKEEIEYIETLRSGLLIESLISDTETEEEVTKPEGLTSIGAGVLNSGGEQVEN